MVYCQRILENPGEFISEIRGKLQNYVHSIETPLEDTGKDTGYFMIDFSKKFDFPGDMQFKRNEIQALIQGLAEQDKKSTM